MGRFDAMHDPAYTNPTQIRRADRADVEALAAVNRASWQAGYRGTMPQDALDALTDEEFAAIWRAQIKEDGRETYMCLSGKRAVGFVSFGPCRDDGIDGDRVAEIYGIYVLAAAWGRGHGRDMLRLAIENLDARRFAEVVLWVLRENDRARRFYERAGFCLDPKGQKTVSRFDTDLHHVRYRRKFATAW